MCLVSVNNIWEMVSVYVLKMNLDDASGGDLKPQESWLHSELTQFSVSHSQLHRMPPNAWWG